MPRRDPELVTVSPPTIDRTAFVRVDRALTAQGESFSRDWVMERFEDGLQIRMLPAPALGFVVFQPGRLAWRPIVGAERAMVVHGLRVAPGEGAKPAAKRLWTAVESFASYYGYSAVLAMTGASQGLVDPELAPCSRHWVVLDEGPQGARLIGRVLQGPLPLPHLPSDWSARARRLGLGIVIQTTGECAMLERRAARLVSHLAERGTAARIERMTDPVSVRHNAVSPGALFSVVADGVYLGGPDLTDETILNQRATCLA